MTIAGGEYPGAPLYDDDARSYDALLVVSYGGPEGPDDVMPFLENATRGRSIPRERLEEVGAHYHHFGGVSPINGHNRALAEALGREMTGRGAPLPVYLGNRNWHPFLEDTLRRMRDDGVRRGLALMTSAFSSYSGCRQYREDVIRAAEAVGPGAPVIDRIRAFYDHPGFIEANVDHLRRSLDGVDRAAAAVVFTAHSIPASMAGQCAYESQLRETARLVAAGAGVDRWTLAYQSRSGPPQVPWLGPDIGDHLAALARSGLREVVVLPIGFVSDHMEVLYDLDLEARACAGTLGLGFRRVPTVGIHPAFVRGLGDLVLERMTAHPRRPALGSLGVSHDICPVDCCRPGTSGQPLATPVGR